MSSKKVRFNEVVLYNGKEVPLKECVNHIQMKRSPSVRNLSYYDIKQNCLISNSSYYNVILNPSLDEIMNDKWYI